MTVRYKHVYESIPTGKGKLLGTIAYEVHSDNPQEVFYGFSVIHPNQGKGLDDVQPNKKTGIQKAYDKLTYASDVLAVQDIENDMNRKNLSLVPGYLNPRAKADYISALSFDDISYRHLHLALEELFFRNLKKVRF